MKTAIKVLFFQKIEDVDYIASCTAGVIVWIQLFTLAYSLGVCIYGLDK